MSLVMLGAVAILPGLLAQTSKPANAAADWPMYNHDSASTRFSPLKQIDIANVAELTQAWTFTTAMGAPAPGRGGAGIGAEVTPVVVNGIMYLPAANLVVAIDTHGGKEVWRYQLVFIGSVNDNRFRAFDSKNGKEYVAIVAGRTVHTFALP